MEQITGIYKITNKINQHFYIGMSVDIKKRWNDHKLKSLRKNDKEYEKPLYRAFRKYGFDNFNFEILEVCKEEELSEREIYWINKTNALNENNYNVRNSWQPQIKMEEDYHPNHKLSKEDVIDIRTRYNNHERCKDVEALYKHKIGHSGFSKVWKGETWKKIMPEVYTEENKKFHLHNTGNKGSQNGRAKFTEDEVKIIRTRKKNGEKRQEVYKDYSKKCSDKYFQEIWYGYKWKHIIV